MLTTTFLEILEQAIKDSASYERIGLTETYPGRIARQVERQVLINADSIMMLQDAVRLAYHAEPLFRDDPALPKTFVIVAHQEKHKPGDPDTVTLDDNSTVCIECNQGAMGQPVNVGLMARAIQRLYKSEHPHRQVLIARLCNLMLNVTLRNS